MDIFINYKINLISGNIWFFKIIYNYAAYIPYSTVYIIYVCMENTIESDLYSLTIKSLKSTIIILWNMYKYEYEFYYIYIYIYYLCNIYLKTNVFM